ncbi:hypothetical protein [Bradyrhizobium genosp. A]|uniref:hypothetical protein n=1 Tax=Bradyrhizobium genosp. A TaxID=83626 RepID=UPI003CE8D5D4
MARFARLAGGRGIPATLFFLAMLLVAVSVPVSSINAMSAHEILYLNRFGENASDVSWCNDKTFTFLTHGPARNASSAFPPEYSRDTTVNMFMIETQQIRPLVVSEFAAFGAECVKNGEYIFLSGGLYSARASDARLPAQVPFSQFIDVRPRVGAQSVTPVLQLRRDSVAFSAPLRTAPDGSVYSQASSQAIDLDSIVPSKQSSLIATGQDYSVVREGVQITFANADSRKRPPGLFPLYGFSAPEIWSMGSYVCSTSRPGCKSSETGASVGYYLYTKVNTDRARLDLVFTIRPLHEPLVQRWPVVGGPAIPSSLRVSALALDARHCYVLLEPDPSLPESRINGRLKLDLYLSRCTFAAGRLTFDQAEIVGQKQASFIVPVLSLHGDFAVVTETADFASQQDDQADVERAAASRPNVCARFLRVGSWPLEPANTICVRLAQDGADGLSVSPDGNFLNIRSRTNPLIVGREYRNGEAGPSWLNNGEQQ